MIRVSELPEEINARCLRLAAEHALAIHNGVHDPKITNTSSRFTRAPEISPLF